MNREKKNNNKQTQNNTKKPSMITSFIYLLKSSLQDINYSATIESCCILLFSSGLVAYPIVKFFPLYEVIKTCIV